MLQKLMIAATLPNTGEISTLPIVLALVAAGVGLLVLVIFLQRRNKR